MTDKDIEKYFNYLNEIYYELYNSHLLDKITYTQWEISKQSIWNLKDTLKNAKNTTNTENK